MVSLVGKTLEPENIPYLNTILTLFEQAKIPVYLSPNLLSKTAQKKPIPASTTIIIALGGDGTILETLTLMPKIRPVLGINLGKLGFLANVQKENLTYAIEQLIAKKYIIEKRDMVSVNIAAFGKVSYGLNEFAIHKLDSSSMLKMEVSINNEFLNNYWADGLIISTPTGSTGYSLSCGGPVVYPETPTWIINAVAPHNLNIRPLVVPNHYQIKIKIPSGPKKILASLDSRAVKIEASSEILIQKSNLNFELIRLTDQSFIKTLKNKILWGLDNRN